MPNNHGSSTSGTRAALPLNVAISGIESSPTIAVAARARQLRAEGRDIVDLSVGEPDLPPPDSARQAAVSAINEGRDRYTAADGMLEVKEAVREKFRRDNGLEYSSDEIIVSSGAKQVIYYALAASLNPGDQVLCLAPYWVSYPTIVRLCRAEPVIHSTRMEDGFIPHAPAIEAKITERTRWLILNSPGNPTGSVLDRPALEAVAEVLRRHPQVMALCDDIYEHLVYDDAPFVTLAQVAPDLRERILTVNGMSKGYCMPGWRIGFAGGPAPLVRAMAKLQAHASLHPSTISQVATAAALTGPQEFLGENRRIFLQRRDIFHAAVSATRLAGLRPQGAFYVFASCEGWLGRRTADGRRLESETEIVHYLLEEHGLAVVPGAAFGTSPFLRFSFAAENAVLEEAIRRLQAADAAIS